MAGSKKSVCAPLFNTAMGMKGQLSGKEAERKIFFGSGINPIGALTPGQFCGKGWAG